MDHYEIIRCPRCGGMHLEGMHEKPMTFMQAIWEAKSLWGLYKALRREPASCWRCVECGQTFPMENL